MDTTLFYKYRAINNYKDLAEDFSLDGLLKSYAVFSGRKNFNDLFDSKIQLEYPTTEQLLSLLSDPNINEQGKKIQVIKLENNDEWFGINTQEELDKANDLKNQVSSI